MERAYVWEADYGNRKQIKPILKELLRTQKAASLEMLAIFINNNPYNLELFIAVIYNIPQEGHIEKMTSAFEGIGLVQRKDITALTLMKEMGNRRFNSTALGFEEQVDIVFDDLFFFADRDELMAKGYSMKPYGKEKQVFISHSSKDKDDIEKLVPFLNGQEFPVWFDKYSIPVSGSITNSVQKGIDDSDTVLFWITKNFLDSNWCKFEMTAFIKKLVEEESKIFMVLDDEVNARQLPVFLRDIKYIRRDGKNIYEIAEEILRALKKDLPYIS